jgi:Fe-S-cluster-containing dehydrogenase component
MHGPDLLSGLLADQQRLLTPVAEFADWHKHPDEPLQARHYRGLIPLTRPGPGEQYAFEVDLDACTGCTSCVVACHALNGLDEEESWRDVGTLRAPGYEQTVTTACHHCADPACSNGCPTLAYEKDVATGIVRHLDDQCIGCSYCVMKCPYDVPKFNRKRGIVRKCDMCHGRLAAGEAPACVQACPNGAISIRIVSTAEPAPAADPVLRKAFDSTHTRPTTRYRTRRSRPEADAGQLPAAPRVEPAHFPLAAMLALTQAGTGGLTAASVVSAPHALTGVSAALLAIGVAVGMAHLGQPLKAWKAFLGWRRSWLSREVIAFGLALATAAAAAAGRLPVEVAAAAALLAVGCSVMVYVDTRREHWNARLTTTRFLSTTAILGAALAACWEPRSAFIAAPLMLGKLLLESLDLALRPRNHSVRTITTRLAGLFRSRVAAGITGAACLFLWPPAGFALLAGSELLQKTLFFRAVRAHRMPGL